MQAKGFRGIAPLRVEVRFSGTPAQLISFAEALNGDQLDSRDMGDAMGIIIEHTLLNAGVLEMNHDGESLTADLDYGSFQWEQTPMNFDINLDSLPPSP